MTDLPPTIQSLPARMGARWTEIDGAPGGFVDSRPELCSHDVLRVSVLAMLVDTTAGLVADQRAGEDWTFTSDLSLRTIARPVDRVETNPGVIREGQRAITVDVPLIDAAGNRIGGGVSTFAKLSRRPDDPPKLSFGDGPKMDWPDPEADLAELLAPRSVPRGLEVDLDEHLLNPAGVLQGGVAALLAELAAQQRLEAASGHCLVGTDLDIRYVSMGRVGPVRAEVEILGEPGDHMAQVILRDGGADDRVVTHNLIGFAAV